LKVCRSSFVVKVFFFSVPFFFLPGRGRDRRRIIGGPDCSFECPSLAEGTPPLPARLPPSSGQMGQHVPLSVMVLFLLPPIGPAAEPTKPTYFTFSFSPRFFLPPPFFCVLTIPSEFIVHPGLSPSLDPPFFFFFSLHRQAMGRFRSLFLHDLRGQKEFPPFSALLWEH